MNEKINSILQNYTSSNLGLRTNLYRFLNNGKLANTGHLLFYSVDQGFEHGPIRSFGENQLGYDPLYHHNLAIKLGFSGFVAPLGMLEVSANKFCGQIPTILKLNSANMLHPSSSLTSSQAITGSVQDAIRLGCSAIGFTIYPGSENTFAMFEQLQKIAKQAKDNGLVVIVWSYPRGNMSTQGETALDTISYATHMACLLGADIIKVKIPRSYIESKDHKAIYENNNIDINDINHRISCVKQSCFDGKRILIFSGGEAKAENELLNEIKAIKANNCGGSIIGRNIFKRSASEAEKLTNKIVDIYLK